MRLANTTSLILPTLLAGLAATGLWCAMVSGQPEGAGTVTSTQPPRVASEIGDKIKPPTQHVPLSSCVTSDCHPGVKQHTVLHGPLNVNTCNACHESVDESKHTFTLTRKTTELCQRCHRIDTKGDAFVHKPYETGECTGCHDPHGGEDERLLKPNAFGSMCATCHKDHEFSKLHSVHGPVASGECFGCHTAHTGSNKKLLVREGRELCVNCHREINAAVATFAVSHKPAEEGCAQCHNPHATEHNKLLRDAAAPVCTSTCHEPIRRAIADAPHQHPPVTQDAACVNCHLPHGGQRAAMMKTASIDACMRCHDKPIEKGDKTVVASMTALRDKSLFAHGPVREGRCGGCHEVHGSDHTRLLAGEFTLDLYEAFSQERYDLCFQCHQRDMVGLPRSAGATAFRDGDKNLHYVHVNRVKNGRTCNACHDTHVSKDRHLIRDQFAIGDWEFPVNFKATATGGSCAPGCHQPLRYDRDKPFNDRARPVRSVALSPDARPARPGPTASVETDKEPSP